MCLARGQFVHHNERTIAMSFPARTSLALAFPFLACLPTVFALASCGASKGCALNDYNCDQVPDDIGEPLYGTSGQWLEADTDNDGLGDGYAIDEDGDGNADGVAIDVDKDGLYDGIDRNGDGIADRTTGEAQPGSGGSGSGGSGGSGSGGRTGTGGTVTSGGGAPPSNTGGTPGGGGTPPTTGGTTGTGGTSPNFVGSCLTPSPVHSGTTTTSGKDVQANTWRQNCSDVATCPAVQYKFIANGWGPNWQSHTLTYGGTKLSVDAYAGSQGSNYEPAGYPTVFCGLYSNIQSGACGLPAPINSIQEIDTGLKWTAATQGSDYNVAYDIWIGNGNNLSAYLMVWMRDPPNAQPAGSVTANNIYVGDDPKRWDVWTGSVNNHPIVNYVRPANEVSNSDAFDAMDFVDHAKQNYNLPGDTLLAVAVGFEIWNGPVAGLKVDDFCVEVH
jgi:hypothetical protein